MIEQTSGSAHQQIVYGPDGMKLALMNGQTLVNAFVKLPGGARAVYNSSGLAYYRHSDHLGSSRLATTATRTKYYDVAYAPYGEDYNGSGTTPDLAFTDQNQDTVKNGWSSNLYDFMLREYRTAHGRWTSPDPAGLGAVNPANPQSWNRYSYVVNNPTGLIDPLGLTGGTFSVSYPVWIGNCLFIRIDTYEQSRDGNRAHYNYSTMMGPVACIEISTGQWTLPNVPPLIINTNGGAANNLPGQCSVAVSCHPTQLNPNKVHCGITTTANGMSTRYDGGPTDNPSGKSGQAALGSQLAVNVQGNTGTPSGDTTIFSQGVSCGVVSCIGQTAYGINSANAPYSLLPMLWGSRPFTSNAAARAMTSSCGLNVSYPSNAPGAEQ